MSMIRMKLTVPNVNVDWWRTSKNELTKVVEDYNRSTWPSQSDPVTGAAWAPRKPPTGSWPLLRLTGKMQDSAKFKAGSAPMSFYAITTNYGPYLQYGTSKMVARRWLGIGPKILDPMAAIIAKQIFKGKKTTITIP